MLSDGTSPRCVGVRAIVRCAFIVTVTILSSGLWTPLASQPAPDEGKPMKILVHITHGPESPTRAALGFHVAKGALEEGHEVTVFLAGDAVQLVREGTLDRLVGLGTGKLGELHDTLVSSGASFYLSGGSSRARSLQEADLGNLSVQFAAPRDLVRLSVEHDRMFTY